MTGRSKAAGAAKGHSILRPGPAEIRPDRMLRLQGYRSESQVRPRIRAIAEQVAARAQAVMTPEIHFCRRAMRFAAPDVIELEGDITFQNPAFARFLAGSDEAIVFVLTMGAELDQAVQTALANDDLLTALLLETAGWLGVEWTTKRLLTHLTAALRPDGLRLTTRLGPGYRYKLAGTEVDWPLEQQRQLFAVFAQPALPIRLLDSCVMVPKLSRSGLYGLLPDAGAES